MKVFVKKNILVTSCGCHGRVGVGAEMNSVLFIFLFIFGLLSVLSTCNNESVNICTDLQSYSGPVWTFCSFFTRTASRTDRRDAIFYLSLGVCDFFGSAFDKFVSAFFCQKGIVHFDYKFFSSLKILDSQEQDVASSTVAQEGEDTQAMRVVVDGEIPADSECINNTFLVFYTGNCVYQQLDLTSHVSHGSNRSSP